MTAQLLTISIEENAPPEVQTSIDLLLDEEAKGVGYPLRVRQFCAVL